MQKKLAAIAGVLLVLCSATAMAAQKEVTAQISPVSNVVQMDRLNVLPDLVVKSAQVTGAPFTYRDIVIMPLRITIANNGAGTSRDFNVGAVGTATDGNAYGFDYIVPGEATMEDPRGGILCHGLAAGVEKTYQGYLFMGPIRVGETLRPGTRYTIDAMVDYNLDPDSGYYEWGVSEKNEGNNKLTINYP
jgi:hypothetical protein